VKAAQGNPGKRAVLEIASDENRDMSAGDAAPRQRRPRNAMVPFARLNGSARTAYDLIGSELRRLNFVRSSDESVLVRYCKSLADFWIVTGKLDKLGDHTYECQMTGGGTMQRIHPLFIVQQHLAKRLESMEDRLGLSPQARQQYLLRIAASGRQALLPLDQSPKSDAPAPAPTIQKPLGGPVGLLRRDALN
jgi:P27 family predicted phage terminase small subunit